MSTAHINGIDVYYEEQGEGDPLLLIMGLAADSLAWMFQLPDFSKHFRTVVFDNRGVGRSSKPAGPYSIAAMAEDAAARERWTPPTTGGWGEGGLSSSSWITGTDLCAVRVIHLGPSGVPHTSCLMPRSSSQRASSRPSS